MASSKGPDQGGVQTTAVGTSQMHPAELRGVGGRLAVLTHRQDADYSPLRHPPLLQSPGDAPTYPSHPAKTPHHPGGLWQMADKGKHQLHLGT